MINDILKHALMMIILVLVQVLILNNINLTRWEINPFLYVLFILLLPFSTPRGALLLSAFMLGIFVDMFTGNTGLNAFACVVMAYLRPPVLNSLRGRDGYDSITRPRVSYYGFKWFLKYTIILVFIHHLAYYSLEVFSISRFPRIIINLVGGTLFTTTLVMISQYLFWRK